MKAKGGICVLETLLAIGLICATFIVVSQCVAQYCFLSSLLICEREAQHILLQHKLAFEANHSVPQSCEASFSNGFPFKLDVKASEYPPYLRKAVFTLVWKHQGHKKTLRTEGVIIDAQ